MHSTLLFLLSIPLTHQRVANVPPASLAMQAPAPTTEGPSSLTLYNVQGHQVAVCVVRNDIMVNCKIKDGFDLDDVFNAWARAYQDATKETHE